MVPSDRLLATILFTDIVESTQRAEALGDREWRHLLEAHHAAVRREVERHEGREWGTAGDGFLVTFAEPEKAVRCAVAIRNAVGELDLRVRCGIHAGEVQRIDDGIGGIAVHIAARIAALARPDEVLVSRTVRDLVTGSGLAFEDRGKRALKGAEGSWRIYALATGPALRRSARAWAWTTWPGSRRAGAAVAILAVLALAVSATRPWNHFRASPAGASVAVLPFTNRSPDPADEYFSDGLTEELISALAEIEGLRVPGRTSSFAFKDRAQDVREIGRVLEVGHILEGSVRRSGERLRIDARLVNAAEGFEVWSESYDRTVADALEIQASIARAISEALEVELLPQRDVSAPTPEAYDLYLKALSFSNAPTERGVKRAIEHYLLAIEADPGFAPAHAGLAIAYHGLGNRYGAGQAIYLPRAKDAAERALSLDPSLPEGHLARAIVMAWWERDYQGAERAFRRAIELRSSYAPAYGPFAAFLIFMHRHEEGLAAGRMALSLDPLSNLQQVDFGAYLYFARRYLEAVEQLRLASDRNPGDARPWLLLARTYEQLGRWDEVFDAYERAERLPGHEGIKVLWKGHSLAASGQRAATEALLARADSLAGRVPLRETDFAAFELAQGHRERALARIERAERERTLDPVPLQGDPRLDPLRSDPRFRAVVRRMGLPEREPTGSIPPPTI